MKTQKRVVAPLFLFVVTLLIIGGGMYIYENKKTDVPVVDNTQTSLPIPAQKSSLTSRLVPTQTPILIPKSFRFEASPILGAPPLNVTFGGFSSEPLQFDNFSINYGDGSLDFLQQECFESPDAKKICQIMKDRNNYISHSYKSSGTFVVTLYGIKKDDSQILSTLTITVGNPLNITKTVGEKEGSFLIRKINRDSVEGLWYEVYPVATEQGTPKTLHIGDDIGYECEGVSDKLTSIDFSQQKIIFTVSWSRLPYGECPV